MSTIKPVEIKTSQYYVHKSYIPSYYWVYVLLEQWIAAAVFRNDTSRVFMASDGYAFRRRFELTDMSENYDEIEASSLRFPFANYNPLNTGWIADNRPAANTATMVYLGVYEGNTKVKASAVYQDIPVSFYFDREDDARLAYDRLFFYTYNEHYYSLDIPFGSHGLYPDGEKVTNGSTLKLPININIKGIRFNPNFTESDWLKRNRIFVISATFSCRTYAIYPPAQPDFNAEKNSTGTDYGYEDGTESFYLVNDVILNMVNETYNIRTYNGVEEFPEEGSTDTIYVDSYLEDTVDDEIKTRRIEASKNYYRWNPFSKNYEIYEPYKSSASSVRVYGEAPENRANVNRLYVKRKTVDTGTIAWTVTDSDYLSKIELIIDGSSNVITLEPGVTEYTFENLTPGSRYNVYLNFFSIDGSATSLQISFSTKESTKTKKDLNTLVGTSW